MNVLVLAVFTPALALQTADTTQRPPSPERYTINVAALARDGVPSTLSDVLASQVPGLLVIPGSGLNGSGARVRFVGVQSLLADSPPLVFLDGTRIDVHEDDSQLVGGPGPSRLDDIPLEDVQSVDVLRGPVSTAIYGPGAAAGVILIRTKAERSGPVHVEGVVQGGMRSIPSRWPTNYGGVDQDNVNAWAREGRCDLQAEAVGLCVQDLVQSFNPLVQRNPFSTAPHRQFGLSATAGPTWGAFRVSGTFDGDPSAYGVPSVTWSDDYRQWNLRASGTMHPMQNVDVAVNAARIVSTLRLPMYQPVLAALLGPSDSTGFSWDQVSQSPGTQNLGRTLVGLDAHARPTRWLALQAILGFDDLDQRELQIRSTQAYTSGRRNGSQHTLGFNATVPNLAWRGLRFTTTLGIERVADNGDQSVAVVAAPNSWSTMQTLRHMRWVGVYGIEQVAFSRRFVVTGTLRHDAFTGSAFASYVGGGTHPSLALDWIARPDQPGVLGQLALRAAYGTAAQPPATVLESFSIGFPPLINPPFPRPKHEATREFAFSAEASGLGGRWRAQATAYDLRSNPIESVPQAYAGGCCATAYLSGAVIDNRGVTASVSARLVDRPQWGWDAQLSVWGNRNRMVKWAGPPQLYSANGFRLTGQMAMVGYPTGGYWTRPLTGFADANGDGIITAAEVAAGSTWTWVGTPYPTQGAALTTSWRVAHRVRLSAILDYRAGQTLFNETANLRCLYALCRERNDRATPPAAQAVAVAADIRPQGYYEDADYLKLRELAIAFEVPERTAAALGARSATVVLGGRNLVTWTKYSGADPEAGSYGRSAIGSPPMIGDFATVPVARSWTVRVRLAY